MITFQQNFFVNMKALRAERRLTAGDSDGHHHYNDEERELLSRCVPVFPSQSCAWPFAETVFLFRLDAAQSNFRLALCDSFDTTKALQIIFELVSIANVYIGRGRSAINVEAVSALEEWITRMLRMLGLGEGSTIDSNGEKTIGWGTLAIEGETVIDVRYPVPSSRELMCLHRYTSGIDRKKRY